MEKVSYLGLQDLWQDFQTSYLETLINLKTIKIYQVRKIDPVQDGYGLAEVLVTDTETLKQQKRYAKIPASQTAEVARIGLLYQAGKQIYIPTDDVKNRIFGDYFHKDGKALIIHAFSYAADVLALAEQFRKIGKIVFVTQKTGGYRTIVSVKSAKQNTFGIMPLIHELIMHYGTKTPLYTDYIERVTSSTDFSVICQLPEHTKDGNPLYVAFHDSIAVRKPVLIDIVTNIHGRFYILDTMKVSHKATGKGVVDDLYQKLSDWTTRTLRLHPSMEMVQKQCLTVMSKTMQAVFLKELDIDGEALESAHDALYAAFKTIQKQHKTAGYDAGKRKAELSLGQILV